MDEGDAMRGTDGLHAMAIDGAPDRDGAFIGAHDAAEHLDEGGFAGAVLPQQRHDIAARNLEAHAFQRAGAPE